MKEVAIATLVQLRLEQAQTTLEDARFLLEGSRSSLSIINRSYYAMFYAAMALLQQLPRVPSKHSGVISLFDTEFVLKGIFPKELSKAVHKAFELRQSCDYRVTKPHSIKRARQAYDSAAQFVHEVSRHLSQSDS